MIVRKNLKDIRNEAKNKKIKAQKKAISRKYFDLEAELGSDNEANDHRKKKIKNDRTEDDSDLESDLDGFVDHADKQEIGGSNSDMIKKFRDDCEADDLRMAQQLFKQGLPGSSKNRKRKRGEVDLEADDSNSLLNRKM